MSFITEYICSYYICTYIYIYILELIRKCFMYRQKLTDPQPLVLKECIKKIIDIEIVSFNNKMECYFQWPFLLIKLYLWNVALKTTT